MRDIFYSLALVLICIAVIFLNYDLRAFKKSSLQRDIHFSAISSSMIAIVQAEHGGAE